MHSIFALLFYIFLCFQHVIADPDVATYKPLPEEENRVNVQLDQPLAVAAIEPKRAGTPKGAGREGSRYVFMAHHQVPGPLTDLQIIKIARDGFMDMLTQGRQYKMESDHMPLALTAFYFNNQIILASSQRGGLSLTYTRENGIDELVRACIHPQEKSKQAKCGEMNALHVFQHLYPEQPIRPQNIATVTIKCGDDETDETNFPNCAEESLIVFPPCDPGDRAGGCIKLIGEGKLLDREIPPKTWTDKGNADVTYSKTGWVTTPLERLSLALPTQ